MIKLAKRKSNKHWIDVGDGVELLIDYPTLEQEQELNELMINNSIDGNVRQYRYASYYIRCTVKDWKGIDEEFKLDGNLMEYNIWLMLTNDMEQTLTLWNKIFEELKFDENDKKKL